MNRLLTILVMLLLLAMPVFAGGQQEGTSGQTDATEGESTGAAAATPPSEFNESPMLAEMVRAGELPPVQERISDNPVVVQVDGEPQYGGTARIVRTNGLPASALGSITQGLRWNENRTDLIGYWIEDYEVNEDSTEYTFYLREGVRWSDGEPLTTEDIQFWVEDITLNSDLYGDFWGGYKAGGENPTFDFVDDYTFTVSYPQPKGDLLQVFANGWRGYIAWPKHVLSQYHASYADADELERLMEDGGFEEWSSLFWSKALNQSNPELPTLGPYYAYDISTDGSNARLRRNPYYWAVDQYGNQLPYIDEIRFVQVEDQQIAVLQTLSGDNDMIFPDVFGGEEIAVVQGRERGGYRVMRHPLNETNAGTIYFNYTHENEAIRTLMNDKRFREAVSFAIDREDLLSFTQEGTAVVGQYWPIEGSPYYVPGSEDEYVEFNPGRANELLDELGLDERDSDGFRLLPNGEEFSLNLIGFGNPLMDIGVFLDMISTYLETAGIRSNSRTLSRQLWEETVRAGDFDLAVRTHAGNNNPINDGRNVVPTNKWYAFWARDYGAYYEEEIAAGTEVPEDEKEGVAPPEGSDWYELWDMFQEYQGVRDPDERISMIQDMWRMHIDNLWAVGTMRRSYRLTGVASNMYFDDGVTGWIGPFTVASAYFGE